MPTLTSLAALTQWATITHVLLPATASIIGLGFLIGFHELGHFLFCKLFHILTPSFSIGFGPRIFTKKIGTTEFSLSAIPFGGYVEIAGNAEIGQGDQLNASLVGDQSFANKPYWQKLLVMLGGILFNLFFAYIAFIFLFATGVPKTTLISYNSSIPVIASVQAGSPAEKAGLKVKDRIIALEGIAIGSSVATIKNILNEHETGLVTFQVERDNALIEITITPDSQALAFPANPQTRILGISYDVEPIAAQSIGNAISYGISETHRWITQTAQGFLRLRNPQTAVKEMAGPLMILYLIMQAAIDNFKLFLLLLAIISINLAVLNMIPLPILDGGQILFATIEFIIRRPLPEKIRLIIHLATWIMFILLFIFLSLQDVRRLFGF